MKGGARRAARYEGLRKVIRGLRDIASGGTIARVIIRANRYLAGRVRGELDRHVKTGLARQSAAITASTSSIDVRLQAYYKYIRWSFKKGFPISALNRIQKIADEEYQKALRGEV